MDGRYQLFLFADGNVGLDMEARWRHVGPAPHRSLSDRDDRNDLRRDVAQLHPHFGR